MVCAPRENLRSIANECHRVERAAGQVHVGVAGRPSRRDNDGIDDRVKTTNACESNSDGLWRRASTGCATQEIRVVTRDDAANRQNTKYRKKISNGKSIAGQLLVDCVVEIPSRHQ